MKQATVASVKRMNVKVPMDPWHEGGETVTVQLEPHRFLKSEWDVLLDGKKIGVILKSSYTYSPPIHRGSRIARHHSRVSCWKIHGKTMDYRTRREGLRRLIEAHREENPDV